MTDAEYELLDCLYFTVGYDQLVRESGLTEEQACIQLRQLLQQDWARAIDPSTEEEVADIEVYDKEYKNLFFLASKKGLMAHNTR